MQSTMHYERVSNRTHICTTGGNYLVDVSSCRLRLTEYVVSDDLTILRKMAGCVGAFHFMPPHVLTPDERYRLRVEQGLTLDIRIVLVSENEATFVGVNIDKATWAKLMERATPIIKQDDMIDAFRLQVSLLEQRVVSLETRVKENLNGYTPT